MWARRAVEKGSLDATVLLGVFFCEEKTRKWRDPPQGLQLLRSAAAAGHVDALRQLGDYYTKGSAVPRDLPRGCAFLCSAAAKGDAMSQRLLGHLYRDGERVPRDPVEASKWYRMAALQGDLDAMICLVALLMEDRVGDPKEVTAFCQQAAQQGRALAEYWLSLMYFAGTWGMPSDFSLGMTWLEKAAVHDAEAKCLLDLLPPRQLALACNRCRADKGPHRCGRCLFTRYRIHCLFCAICCFLFRGFCIAFMCLQTLIHSDI
jgi:TPR repeat protein